jgi:geranylgeranyl diphosphate synthase type II
MVDLKTAYYSIIGPIQLGALIAGASPQKIKSVFKFGIPLGRCFQIIDDVINLTEKSRVAGKKQYGDIIEGKRTLMLIHLLKNCNLTEKEFVKTIYRTESRIKEQAEIDYIIRLMNKYKSIDYAKEKALEYSLEATREFEYYCQGLQSPDPESKKMIKDLIEVIVKRKN